MNSILLNPDNPNPKGVSRLRKSLTPIIFLTHQLHSSLRHPTQKKNSKCLAISCLFVPFFYMGDLALNQGCKVSLFKPMLTYRPFWPAAIGRQIASSLLVLLYTVWIHIFTSIYLPPPTMFAMTYVYTHTHTHIYIKFYIIVSHCRYIKYIHTLKCQSHF